jgi:parallel beta-helix repeat protein
MNACFRWFRALPLFAIIAFFSKTSNSLAETDIPAGSVSGLWTKAGSPYRVNGEITIPDGETLTMEPGVDVIFTGHYKFNVQGRLLAMGTREDSITFTAQDPDVGWHGIRFVNTPNANDTSKIVYCSIKNGRANTGNDQDRSGGAICIVSFKKVLISNCLIDSNSSEGNPDTTGGGGIALLNAPATIVNCEFEANTSVFGTAIVIWSSSNALISNNHFHDNTGHGIINIGAGSAPILVNNLIESNHSTLHGVVHFSNNSGRAVLMNNTIANNTCAGGGAIYVGDGSTPLFVNDILYGNTPAQFYFDAPSVLSLMNCLVEGGRDGFTGAAFSGTYQDCIDADPLFAGSDDFHLQDGSPCIGAGADSVKVSKKQYYASTPDFEGNPRPNPVNTHPDLGAFEDPSGEPLSDIHHAPPLPDQIQLCPNYPNPFNPTTTVGFRLPHRSLVKINVYDMLGRKIRTILDAELQAGEHSVLFDAGGLASGLYAIRLETEGHVEKRMACLVN